MLIEFLSVFFSIILLIHVFVENNIIEPLIDEEERKKLSKELETNELLLDKIEKELDEQFDKQDRNDEEIEKIEKLYEELHEQETSNVE